MTMTTSAKMINIRNFPNPDATATEPSPIPTAVVRLPSANAFAVDATFSPVTPPIEGPAEGADVFPKLSPPKLFPVGISLAHWVLIPRGWRGARSGSFFVHTTRFKIKLSFDRGNEERKLHFP